MGFRVAISLSLLFVSLALFSACKRGARCIDGDCICDPGRTCEFECEEPPCHVDCVGDNPQCDGECANADCYCGPDSDCSFACAAPPCHVECEGSACDGQCANGDCLCDVGADCTFSCDSGPCHVMCAGQNDRCTGECENGSCTCGPNSTCSFQCLDAGCSFICEEGASCVATCPGGTPGTQGCNFTECAAGEVVTCPDGETLVCGAPCP